MWTAIERVERNGGAPGIDGMTVEELRPYLREHWLEIREALDRESYQPKPVRRVEIPKPDGGKRMIGIPTVVDRLLQQAIAQVLTPLFEERFSEYSYGFRPRRSAHDAVKQAQIYLQEGNEWVVDIDLEKYFDRVNHDMLMARVAREVKDKRVLKLIRGYLKQWGDDQRRGGENRGRDTAGWANVPVVVKHHAGRSRQRTGETRTQICALCG
jgi:RNA-directed DNA polymerase